MIVPRHQRRRHDLSIAEHEHRNAGIRGGDAGGVRGDDVHQFYYESVVYGPCAESAARVFLSGHPEKPVFVRDALGPVLWPEQMLSAGELVSNDPDSVPLCGGRSGDSSVHRVQPIGKAASGLPGYKKG